MRVCVCLCVTKMKTFNDRIQQKGVYRQVVKEEKAFKPREMRRKRVTGKKYLGMWYYDNPCVNNEWLMFYRIYQNING